MTVVNNDRKEYEHLKFVEFLEMIARVAALKFEGTPLEKNTPMEKKVFITLESLLKINGIRAAMPEIDTDSESEVDDDY
jgi:hypothetical protein